MNRFKQRKNSRKNARRGKRLLAALCAIVFLAAGLFGCAPEEQDDGLAVLASFYPVYVLALNVTEGVEGVRVSNMAVPQTGCLHDYQLSTRDMKALERADVFLINGAGMEEFLEKALTQRPELNVVDTSEGAPLLEEDGSAHDEHDEHEEHDEHDNDGHEEHGGHDHDHAHNAHIWMDPKNAAVQVQNIALGLSAVDPANAARYQANAAACAERLEALDGQIRELLAPCAGGELVAFHEGFAYFANAYGLNILDTILVDDNNAPSAREIAAVIDQTKASGAAVLATEKGGEQELADMVAAETGAMVCALDSLVYPVEDGQDEKTAYDRALLENAQTLLAAFEGRTGQTGG